ncbi:MAG: hypothetical protein ACE5G3_01330 [Gammaproteobacteria bacterium]
MSEGVDLSQIRGDWKFHMDYLQNAVVQTLKRQRQYWDELGGNDEIGTSVARQNELWAELLKGADNKGTIVTTDGMLEEFIGACRAGKEVCDTYQDDNDGETVAEFAEACRQVRALCDDLEMMRDQRPADQ